MKPPKVPYISALALRAEASDAFETAGIDNLKRLIAALGNNVTAQLLGVDRAQVSRWNRRKEPISFAMRSRVMNLACVLDKALALLMPDVVGSWLVGSEPLLRGARPIDVLVLDGAAPLLAALDGIYEGVHD